MDTQNRNGMRSFIKNRLPGMVILGMVLLAPAGLNAQSAGPVGPPLSKTKQEANRLVAMTQPGYYKTRLVPDWRAKRVNSAQAVTAVAELCNRSRSPAVMPPTIQLAGERLNEQQVKLSWAISEAVTTDEVGIERSFNPADGFETVASIKGTGTAAQAVRFQTVDSNPHTNYTYYRLKRVDLTGAYTYSHVISVKGEQPPLTVKAFPNPGQQRNVMFQVAGLDATKPLSVAFYDVQGRLLYQREQTELDADRRFALPNVPGLQPGNYYLKITVKGQQAATSFILQQ